MKNTQLVMGAVLSCAGMFACSGSASAADRTCDYELTGGKVTAGKVKTVKLKKPAEASDGTAKQAWAADTTITSGTIVAGVLDNGVASGGKLVAKQCQGAALAGAALTGVTLKGVKAAPADGKTATLEFKDVEIVEAELTDVTVDNPIGVLAAPKEPTVTTEAANIPLAGDWFKFKTEVNRIHLGEHPRDKDPSVTGLRAPRGACFRVATEVKKTGGPEPGDYARGTFYVPENNDFWNVLLSPTRWVPPYGCATVDQYRTSVEASGPPDRIDPNRTYDIPKDLLVTERDRYRSGFTYGVMVAPFKYYRESRTFDAGATVGPYVGYRVWDRQGSSTVLAFGLGATSTKVITTTGGNSTEETKNGVSWAFGVLTEFKNSFNVGVLWGGDMFSSADAVPKNGAHWFSVSIGYKLSN